MSSHFSPNVQMTCADFEKSFDHYVDGLLDVDALAACERHLAMCKTCDREVTRWQQTRILLSTAVADFASAVDVSSLRASVEAALGFPEATEPKRRAVDREASYSRVAAERPSGRRGAPTRGVSREAGKERRASFAAAFRVVSAAAVSAATAAAAVLLLTPGPQNAASVVASAPAVSSSSASAAGSGFFMPASLRSAGRRIVEEVAPVAYTPPPLARPQVSHVDGLEAAPGRQVSTWVQPKTNARVIWVEDRGTGAPVRTAGLDR